MNILNNELNIIIPMGGLGSRFTEYGFISWFLKEIKVREEKKENLIFFLKLINYASNKIVN